MPNDNPLPSQDLRKVCVISLDGATFRVLQPLCEQGKLPNLSELLRKGASGRLLSTIPPVTAAAWASFQTGKEPGKHGIFEFSKYIPGSYETSIVDSSAIQTNTIWDLLIEAGKTIFSINVPMTYPPKPVTGAMISGLLSPNLAQACYPPELVGEVVSVVPDYEFIIPVKAIDYLGVNEYVSRVVRLAEKRAALGKHFMQHDWDFFMLHFQATDIAQHALWAYIDPAHPQYAKQNHKDKELVLSFYKRIDELLGEIIDLLDDTTLTIIMSDHGFGPALKRLYVNEWLLNQGLLHVNWVWRKRLVELLIETLQKADVLKLRRRLIGPRSRGEKLQTVLTQAALIDWPRTKAFALPGAFYARIYLNRQGREPQGIVDEHIARTLAYQIRQGLLELHDSVTAEPVIRNIYFKDEIYLGPATDLLPDLVVEPADGYMIATELSSDSVVKPVPTFMTGTHKRDGILIVKGPNVRHGIKVQGANITDPLPTILYALGVPIPSDLDGKVLSELFDPAYVATHTPIYVDPSNQLESPNGTGEYTPEDELEVEARLKSLGYLD